VPQYTGTRMALCNQDMRLLPKPLRRAVADGSCLRHSGCMYVPDELLRWVGFIGLPDEAKPRGTLFFVRNSKRESFLVTARHVANRLSTSGWFVRVRSGDGSPTDLESTEEWTCHETPVLCRPVVVNSELPTGALVALVEHLVVAAVLAERRSGA